MRWKEIWRWLQHGPPTPTLLQVPPKKPEKWNKADLELAKNITAKDWSWVREQVTGYTIGLQETDLDVCLFQMFMGFAGVWHVFLYYVALLMYLNCYS
jgi:hypothetical protein